MNDISEFPEIAARREKVDAKIKELLSQGEYEPLLKGMQRYPFAGGKRWRPLFAMLTADCIGGAGDRAMLFGIALELIHNFTLVHDDIMDMAETRRKIKCIHADKTIHPDEHYRLAYAIDVGDALFAKGFEVLESVEASDAIVRRLLRETARMVLGIAEGQQMDMDFAQRYNISEEEYLKMIEKKTALMFRTAAMGGAIIAEGSEKQIESCAEFGRLVGIGFQIADDIIDLLGNPEITGKPRGGDLKEGKRTLIVVHALANAGESQKKKIVSCLGNRFATPEEIENCINLLKETGSIKYAEKVAVEFSIKAKECLKILPNNREREILNLFADFMVHRIK
ncbi:MAG: polyprenyl synthetase family protein [Thermoplasmata archaeon]